MLCEYGAVLCHWTCWSWACAELVLPKHLVHWLQYQFNWVEFCLSERWLSPCTILFNLVLRVHLVISLCVACSILKLYAPNSNVRLGWKKFRDWILLFVLWFWKAVVVTLIYGGVYLQNNLILRAMATAFPQRDYCWSSHIYFYEAVDGKGGALWRCGKLANFGIVL